MSFRPTAIQKNNVKIRPGSPIVSAAEEVLCAHWDGRLNLPDSADPNLIANAAVFILNCAQKEIRYIDPKAKNVQDFAKLILEFAAMGDEVDELVELTGSVFDPEEDGAFVSAILKEHGFVITQPEE